MDKSKSPPHSPRDKIIKIKLLDIFPSLNELIQQQEELDIIFQGLDIFYNLYELLETKTELTINIKNKNSLIISLIKSNNIFATCFYTIKQGEQWITFSYENKKKKETSFVQSLIDCIKIKINCEFFQDKNILGSSLILNSKKLNFNYNNKNNYLKQNSNYSSLTTEENFRTTNIKMGKIFSNKGFKNISLECSPKEKLSEKAKYSYIKHEYSKNNKSNKELNTLNRLKSKNSNNKITVDDLNFRINKIVDVNNSNEESKLNLTQKIKKKNSSNNNLDMVKYNNKNINIYNKDNKLYNNFDFDKSKKSKQIIKSKILNNNEFLTELNLRKKPKNQNKSTNKLEKSQENTESLFTSNSIIGSLTNRNNKGSKKEIKCSEKIKTLKNAKTPIITKNNKFQNSKNKSKDNHNKLNNQQNSIEQYEQSSSNTENENDINNNISSSDESINENNGYEKLKEDFILLYNDNYVKNVKEDLLKLEIELFVEKMTGLISTYNFEMNEKKIKNKLIAEQLKENTKNFFILKKLYYKLKLIMKKYKQANTNLNKNLKNIKLINDKEFEANKQEINLFNLLYPCNNIKKEDTNNLNQININKKQELHKIINILLSKPDNRNIISNNDIYIKFMKKEISKESIFNINQKEEDKSKYRYTKPIAKTRIIPKLQQTKYSTRTLYANNKCINENINENNIMNIDLNNDEKNENLSMHNINPHSNIFYNKKTYKSGAYNPNKTYSRKIAK